MYKNQHLLYLTEQYSAQFSLKMAAVRSGICISVTLVATEKTLSRNESQIFKVKLGTLLF